MTDDLNVVHATAVATVTDRGEARRGSTQDQIDIISDGAVAIRNGTIVAVGDTATVLATHGDPAIPTIDATGKTVLPGLVECHSHPLFDGERHDEYAERLAGATLAEVAARGGGIWRSVVATRAAPDDVLLSALAERYRRILAGGVTTLEVKSGYGLTVEEELRHLELLEQSRRMTPLRKAVALTGSSTALTKIRRAAAAAATSRLTAGVAAATTSHASSRSAGTKPRRSMGTPARSMSG